MDRNTRPYIYIYIYIYMRKVNLYLFFGKNKH